MKAKKNPIIRDVLICLLCAVGMTALRVLGVTHEVNAENMYNLGICAGLLTCLFLDALSTFIMNIYFIIRFTRCTPKEFGEFLNAVGIEIKYTTEEENTKDN